MYTNADCTVYNRHVDPTMRMDVWIRTQITGVYWEDRDAVKLVSKGVSKDSKLLVLIPADAGIEESRTYKKPKAYKADQAGAYTLAPGDLIIRGLIDDAIGDTMTQAQLIAKYDDAHSILSAEDCLYGSTAMRHIVVQGE